jgi:OmcA/MtrC family decaheme c-type cytochrome
VHLGVARIDEAAMYEYVINDAVWDGGSGDLTIDFSIERGGIPMNLATAPEWTAGGGASRLAILVGWDTSDYTNEGSGSSPASPISVNALDVGGAITDNMDGTYTTVVDAGDAFGTLTVAIEGHPAADLDGDGTYSDRIAVLNAFQSVAASGGRDVLLARNDVIDIAKCNGCHDSAGQGVSLHGNNRTGEMQVCVLCHNSDATDINRRPADPSTTPDGKAEESIDMKRMLHQIHAGEELEDGVVIYGFGGSVNDFSDIAFTGNIANCETCHLPGTYSTEAARARLATTIDTGAEVDDPSDDLNISQTASVCSSCHDSDTAENHMILHGASFHALDADID